MYAVFEDGSHQYKVKSGDLVRVDYRGGNDGNGLARGERVEFGRVLLHVDGTNVQVGKPALDGVRVVTEVVEHPSEKVTIGKYRRRKNYRRVKGHRQHYTLVRVKHILLAGQSEPAPQPQPTPAPTPAPETPAS